MADNRLLEESAVTQRPLTHVRVLDFGQYLAGPLAGMMLADLGAEVIQINPPGGRWWRSPAGEVLSRGKQVIELDLKSRDGQDKARSLVARADVLIENFRPGVMARLGLGRKELRGINSGLVALSLPGFASSDPDLAGVAAWEAVIAARVGQFTDMGLNRQLMGVNPSFSPLPLASAYGVAFGAMSVLFALGARDRNGGEHIEVPLASALFEGLAYNSEQIEDYPERYKSPREVELERRGREGLPCNLRFAELEEFLDPFYRTYTCADGRGFYVVGASVASHPARILRTLGLAGLLAELPDFDAYLDTGDWPALWSLRNYPVGREDRARIADAMKAAFLTRPAQDWDALFGAAKAPATMQRSSKEWLADAHALASGLVLEADSPHYGRVRQMGNVAWLLDDPAAMDKRAQPVPEAGNTALDDVLAEQPRTAKHATGGSFWLDGLKVLDLTNVIAGPTVGSTLARFGSEVTHVQRVNPSVDPWNAVVFGLQANRGKNSILLDLSSVAGREAFERLLARADVVTMNGTDEQRDALGLSPEILAEKHPRLILVQLDAFGGPKRGPKSDHLGYDDLVQAATGVMLRFGGGMETPEEHAHLGTIDVLTGYCAAIALGAALERLRRTGLGGVARASLAAAGNLIQAPFMYDFDGRAPFDEPSGREVRGWGPLYHCYKGSDGWLFFAAPGFNAPTLAQFPELSDLAPHDEATLGRELAERFRTRPCAFWADTFAGTSAAAMPLGSLLNTRDAALQPESGGEIDLSKDTFRAVRHDQHPMGRWVDLAAPNAVRPWRAQVKMPANAEKYGASTRQVLADIGYGEEEIEQMIAGGAAGEKWSEAFLPE